MAASGLGIIIYNNAAYDRRNPRCKKISEPHCLLSQPSLAFPSVGGRVVTIVRRATSMVRISVVPNPLRWPPFIRNRELEAPLTFRTMPQDRDERYTARGHYGH